MKRLVMIAVGCLLALSGRASTWTEGNKTVLVIPVDFSDATGFPTGTDKLSMSNNIATAIANISEFYRRCSLGKCTMTAVIAINTNATGVFRMPQTAAYYNNGGNERFSELLTDANNAAKAVNPAWDRNLCDRQVVTVTGAPIASQGLAWVGFSGVVIKGISGSAENGGATAHELGHNHGASHANFANSQDGSVLNSPGNVEYGNSFDLMGGTSGQFGVKFKEMFDWLIETNAAVDGRYRTVTNGLSIYRLHAHDDTNTLTTGHRLLRVTTNRLDNFATDYWLGLRQRQFTANTNSFHGVHLDYNAQIDSETHLLDARPLSASANSTDVTDAPLTTGRTLSDRQRGIHITPLGKAGTVPEAMDIAIYFGAFTNNTGPTNLVLTASTNAVATGVPVDFTATATDPDGDPLAYSWTFGDGRIGPLTGAATNAGNQTMSWNAAGEYAVRCVATDLKGGTASRTVIVKVGVTAAPRYRIHGRVLRAGVPVEGVQIYVSSPVPASGFYHRTHTDSDGTYVIANLEAGTYTVKSAPDQSDVYATPASRTVTLGPGNAYGVDFFAGTQARFTIAGTVTSGGSTMAGVTVNDGFRSALSAANGSFVISNVPNGTYGLTASKAPYSFQVLTTTVANANVSGQQIYARQAYVWGYIWGASNDFTVSINDGISSHATTSYAATSTNADYYFFPAMGNWNFTATRTGFSAVPKNFVNPTNVTDAGDYRLDFAATNVTRYTITGTVTEQGSALPGVRLVTGNQTNVTDAFGKYVLVNLTNGSYTVTPSRTSYVFTPGVRNVTINNGNQTAQNFTATNTLNTPPTIAVAAACSPNPVTGATGTLGVLGADDAGEANLTYTWSQLTGPANVAFAANGNNAAKNTTVTFYQTGNYSFRATLRDAGNLTNTSDIAVTVSGASPVMAVAPHYSIVILNQTQQFTVTAWDQFGNTNAPAVTWSASGGGTIDSAGKFVGTTPGGPYTVTASNANAVATATVSVNQAPTVTMTAPPDGYNTPAPATLTFTASADDADGSIASVAYLTGTNLLGSASTPPYSVTWNEVLPGSYAVYARATDNLGAFSTSAVVNITVTGTLITWTGSVSTNWDTSSLNWTNPPDAVAYTEGKIVRFTDVGVTLANTNVFIQPAGVSPGFVQVTNTTAKTFTISGGDLTGAGALSKTGAGTLTFNNYPTGPTYGGGTTIRGGIVSLQPPTGGGTCHLGTGPVTLDGGTFRYHGNNNNSSGTVTNRIIVPSTGTLSTSRGDGTIYSGPLDLAGTLRHSIGGGGSSPSRRVTGPTLVDQGTPGSRRIIVANGGNGNAVISGPIMDGPGTAANPLRISTAGSSATRHLELSATNTFAGGAIIEAGPARVILTGPARLGTGNVIVESNAVLELNGPSNLTATATLDIAGVVSVAPHITNTVAALLTNSAPVAEGIYSSANLAPFLTNSGAIRVQAPLNLPPTVTLTAPTNGTTCAAPAHITLSATATDPDGAVADVTFYNGATPIQTVLVEPYTLTWSNVTVGNYSLWAVATDNAGATATSAVAAVTVAWPFDLWRAAKFTPAELLDPAISGETADPDGDGLKNLLEYALGLEPKTANVLPGPVVESDHLTLKYTRALNATDVTLTPEASGSVTGSWSTNNITVQDLGSDGTIQTNKATDGATISGNASRFLRLRANR